MTKHTYSAGGVVIGSDGKILIVKQRGASWSLPKGHIEEGEDALVAAKREIYEESGVSRLEYIRDLGSFERFRIGKDGHEDKSELKRITLFLFKSDQKELKPVDPDNPEARWVDKTEAVEMLTHTKDKEFLAKVLSDLVI